MYTCTLGVYKLFIKLTASVGVAISQNPHDANVSEDAGICSGPEARPKTIVALVPAPDYVPLASLKAI
jgi:hypothetical protein